MADEWTVRRGGQLLGTIEVNDSDFPWLYGRWSPTAAFEAVAPLFASELALCDPEDVDEGWDEAYRAIWRAGVRLHYPDSGEVPEFLLHIDGDEAWFRWHDEPFESGGVADS